MPNSLVIKHRFHQGKYEVTSFVDPSSDVPKDIFAYELAEDGSLGAYYTLCYLDEVAKIPVYVEGKPVGFGLRLVRWNKCIALYDTEEDMLNNIYRLKRSFKELVKQFTVGTEEVTEVYSV